MPICESSRAWAWLTLACILSLPAFAADPKSEELVNQGTAAFKKRDRPAAIALFTQAIVADASNHVAYYNRGRIYETEGKLDEAMADYNRLLEIKPDHNQTLQLRGALRLRLGQIAGALEDFNRHIELVPAHKAHHWMRGIAFYYNGQYEQARAQFVSCHREETNDVEHVLWHFLSAARLNGIEKAKASLLTVGADPRVPMPQLYSFYAGKGGPDEVVAAANAGSPKIDEMTARLCDAHFYMGHYYAVAGDDTLAREHFTKASAVSGRGKLLGELARVSLKEGRHLAKP